MSTQAIFTPIKVGNNTLTHRVVFAPLTRYRSIVNAVPTDLQAEYYKQRATEGGLLITEATFISRLAGGYFKAPGIYNKEQIEGWKKVTSAVHEKKAFIFNQIWHVGRAGSQSLNPNGDQIVSASPIAVAGNNMLLGSKYEVPHALEIPEIKDFVQEYRQAALNAIEAGFDGVEVHSANGFLLDQFISSGSNKHTGIYGGSIENRARFVLKVIDAVVEAIGAERTAIRLAPGAALQDALDDTPVETYGYIISEVQKKHPRLGYIHLVEVTSNVQTSDNANTTDSLEPYRKLFKGPIISAGGFSTAIEHGLDLAEKTGNLIAFGRQFVANPDLPERLRNGWPLNKYDRSTFYTNEPKGYTDYPFYDTSKN